jgi:hypothetical protein
MFYSFSTEIGPCCCCLSLLCWLWMLFFLGKYIGNPWGSTLPWLYGQSVEISWAHHCFLFPWGVWPFSESCEIWYIEELRFWEFRVTILCSVDDWLGHGVILLTVDSKSSLMSASSETSYSSWEIWNSYWNVCFFDNFLCSYLDVPRGDIWLNYAFIRDFPPSKWSWCYLSGNVSCDDLFVHIN